MNKRMSFKSIVFVIITSLSMFSCQSNNKETIKDSENTADIEVIYFHGGMRCSACVAMEKYARQAIDSVFQKEVSDGKINFRSVDITTPEGEKLADSFEVASSSIFIVANNRDKPERIDMTAFGLKNARSHRKEYKQGIIDQINQFLKK